MIDQAANLANTLGRWLFDQLWQMSIELTILAAIVYAAILLLRVRSATLRHLFWCLLLAKPVAAFLIASPVSLYWFLNPRTEIITQTSPPTAGQIAPPDRTYPVERRIVAGVPRVITRTSSEIRAPLDRFGVLATVWLAGCAVLCLRLVFGFAYVSFLRRTAVPVREGPLRELVDRTAKMLGVRSRVSVGISSVSHGPVLAGVLRPSILIPESLVSALPVEQIRPIIAHELAHAHRRDNLVLLVQRLAEMLFFFHPVVWLGGRMMRREAESACDDVVLNRIGDSATYADSLTKVAEMRLGVTQRLLVNTFAAAETDFSRRLRRILDSRARRVTFRVSVASVGALILIGCLGLPRVAERKPTVKENPAMPSYPESTSPEEETAIQTKTLEGLEFPKWLITYLGCVNGCLDYMGRDVPKAWLYGGTAHAFIIQIHETVDVEAVTAWDQQVLHDLAPNLGYRIGGFHTWKNDPGVDYPARQREAWRFVRERTDRGLPCFGWELKAPYGDYWLITGYDSIGYHYSGWETGGPTPWQKLGDQFIPSLEVRSVDLCEPASDEVVVREALVAALEHAARPEAWVGSPQSRGGLAAYDTWIDALISGRAQRDHHGYNAKAWLECREMAVEFLEEAKRRLPGRCDTAFDQAIEHYSVVRDQLTAVTELHPMRTKGWDNEAKVESEEAAGLLRDAQTAEHQGLLALADIAVGLGAKSVPEVPMSGQNRETPTPAARLVLEGVPKVAHHTDRWRFTPFCHSLDACLQFLGEGEQYDRLMAISGAGFRAMWAPQMWDGGNSDILGMAVQTLEPMRRAYWGAGYEMIPVARETPEGWPQDILRADVLRLSGELTDEAGFRRRIVESINNGRPVIAFGVIGPPEACVITGYDEGGDVLIGWNVFQGHEKVDTEPSGYFRIRDWYGKTHGLLLLGDRVGPPARDELYRSTLLWAVEVLRTATVRDHAAGPAGFEAWAADMANDDYFPPTASVLHGRLNCHWDAMTMQAERATVVAFLTEAAQNEPAMGPHLEAAAAALQEGGVAHGVAPGERDQIARLADPAVRREVAESILATRDAYQRTADLIERALLAAGVPAEDIPHPEPAAALPTSNPDESKVLEGVPKVGFGMIDGHVGMTPFPACMRACLEYMGDDLGFESEDGRYPRGPVYAYLMGTTGAAFRLLWKQGWHGDNVASWLLADDPAEIFRRGFAAAGYEQIASGPVPKDERESCFRPMVVESIRDHGRPVIAHGVIGPPEEAIIAGYDEGGRVAIGWSFFQDDAIGKAGVEFLPNGYFRKRRWEADTWSMMAIGDKLGTPDRRATHLDALKWALHVIREPERYSGDRHNGIAAYDAWAEHILRDDEVASGRGPDAAFDVHSDAVDVVAEGRHYASVFLGQAAEILPEAEEHLLAAARNCKAQHDLMWEIWGIVGSNERRPAQREAFMKPDVRRRIVPLIYKARDKQVEAADHIERALELIK